MAPTAVSLAVVGDKTTEGTSCASHTQQWFAIPQTQLRIARTRGVKSMQQKVILSGLKEGRPSGNGG